MDTLQLAFWRIQEERVGRALAIAEGMLIAIITPAIGGLIDLLGSVDTALVIVGVFFVFVLACSLLITSLRHGIYRHRQRSQVYSATFRTGVFGNSHNATYRKAVPA